MSAFAMYFLWWMTFKYKPKNSKAIFTEDPEALVLFSKSLGDFCQGINMAFMKKVISI